MESSVSEKRKISLSGIQATGDIHLGNYLGALKYWVNLQEECDCVYTIVDLHALTVRQDPKVLRDGTLRSYALGLACGIDPVRSVFFIQSHVHTHAELAWALNCYTPYGELGRMTQFKDKSRSHQDNINAGLFDYPVLMAADILLYQSDVVPVGEDQKQHVELARNIAVRFNGIYGDTFTIPEPLIPKVGARIMSLQEPDNKMSKSDPNPRATIGLLENPDAVMKKFRSAVTDSGSEIVFKKGRDGISNLISIYSTVTGKTVKEVEHDFAGQGYGTFKLAVGEAVCGLLRPIQEKYSALIKDRAYLEQCYRDGALRALQLSGRTLGKVYKKIGILPA